MTVTTEKTGELTIDARWLRDLAAYAIATGGRAALVKIEMFAPKPPYGNGHEDPQALKFTTTAGKTVTGKGLIMPIFTR